MSSASRTSETLSAAHTIAPSGRSSASRVGTGRSRSFTSRRRSRRADVAVVGMGEVARRHADELFLRAPSSSPSRGSARRMCPSRSTSAMPIGTSSNACRNTSCASLSAASDCLALGDVAEVRDPAVDARVVEEVGDGHVEPDANDRRRVPHPDLGAARRPAVALSETRRASASRSSGSANSRPSRPTSSPTG